MDKEKEALKRKVDELDSRTSSLVVIGPPGGLWPHERIKWEKKIGEDVEDKYAKLAKELGLKDKK